MHVTRRYLMTARASATARTRQRIIDAAGRVYLRAGFGEPMQAIAREARVSPATVLNHFADPAELVEAVVAFAMADLGLPSVAVVEKVRSGRGRLVMVCRALAKCYERELHWYPLYARDPDHPAIAAAYETFMRQLRGLVRAALGPDFEDKQALAIAMTLVGWQNFAALRAHGMTHDAAGDALAEVIEGWMRSRGKRGRA
jgi:AcrR family transcriptional regulator